MEIEVKHEKHSSNANTAKLAVFMGIMCLGLFPEIAMAAPWDGVASKVLAIFNNGLTRTAAIIAVIACGIAAWGGKLSFQWAIYIVLGIVLVFGAAPIVDYFIAGVSS